MYNYEFVSVNKVQRCTFKGTVPVTVLYFFLSLSFFFSLFPSVHIISYNIIIIMHIKQKGMIKNKICQLDKG